MMSPTDTAIEAVKLLRDEEWKAGIGTIRRCPTCGGIDPRHADNRRYKDTPERLGHAPDCRRAIIIGAPRRAT